MTRVEESNVYASAEVEAEAAFGLFGKTEARVGSLRLHMKAKDAPQVGTILEVEVRRT